MISNEFQINRSTYILADNADEQRKAKTEAMNTMNVDLTKRDDVQNIANVGSILDMK